MSATKHDFFVRAEQYLWLGRKNIWWFETDSL